MMVCPSYCKRYLVSQLSNLMSLKMLAMFDSSYWVPLPPTTWSKRNENTKLHLDLLTLHLFCHITKTFEQIEGKIQRALSCDVHQNLEMILIDPPKSPLTSKLFMDYLQNFVVGFKPVFSWYNNSIPLCFILWFQEIFIVDYVKRHALGPFFSF